MKFENHTVCLQREYLCEFYCHHKVWPGQNLKFWGQAQNQAECCLPSHLCEQFVSAIPHEDMLDHVLLQDISHNALSSQETNFYYLFH